LVSPLRDQWCILLLLDLANFLMNHAPVAATSKCCVLPVNYDFETDINMRRTLLVNPQVRKDSFEFLLPLGQH